ncbi:glycine receptor subunit alpha-2-like [Glandiceps talaboti]
MERELQLACILVIISRITVTGQNEFVNSTQETKNSSSPAKTKQSVILNTLIDEHETRIRPDAEVDPLQVDIGFYIESFHSVSETDMDYSITTYFRQVWRDRRLTHNYTDMIILNGDISGIFWIPDTFFLNAKNEIIHETPKMNSLFGIYQDGTVFYSMRMTLTLSCHMDLTLFPFDVQECIISIMSYAYKTKDIELGWLDGSDCPVNIQPTVQLPGYVLAGSKCRSDIVEYVSGNYSYLDVAFRLERRLGFYLLQAFVPSIGLVVISWLTLWIDPVSSPARATLAITTLLTLITQAQWIRNEIPKVAYVTAIDIWLVVCLGVVFMLLVEYAVVYYLYSLGLRERSTRREENGQMNKTHTITRDNNCDMNCQEQEKPVFDVTLATFRKSVVDYDISQGNSSDNTTKDRPNPSIGKRQSSYLEIGKRIDKYCRVVSMFLFVAFIVTYWIIFFLLKKE